MEYKLMNLKQPTLAPFSMLKLCINIFISLAVFQSFGQTHDSIAKQLSNDLKPIFAKGHINGLSVAIVNEQGTLFEQGLGYADKKAGQPYTEHTIQNIASISKTFIGVALLKAQEMGALNLDDPINKYLPFKVINPHFPDKAITIKHLATHTSSIKDPSQYEDNGYVLMHKNNDNLKVISNFISPDNMMDYKVFLKNILDQEGNWYHKKVFLKNEPGALFEYSNIAAGLAAFVLEKATGQAFNAFTKTYIFSPLEMSNSGWFRDEVDNSKHSKLYADIDTELAPYYLINYPDGALITSIHDLGKFLKELISGYNGHGTLLNKSSYSELFKPNLKDSNYKKRNTNVYNDEYNIGVFMGISAQGQIGHTGGDPGVGTFMFFNSETKIGKILFVNTELDKAGVNEFIEIWKVLEAYENKL